MIELTDADYELRLGDCLDPVAGLASLPDKSVAHVICDPPYEAEAHSRGRRQSRAGQQYGAGRHGAGLVVKPVAYPPITNRERVDSAAQLARVTRGWILVFCQAEALQLWGGALEAGDARHIRAGVYRKLDAQPQYSGDRPGVGWEAIEISWAGEERTRWNAGGKCAVWEAVRDGRSGGPAPQDGAKPLALMEALISDFTDPGELVCDPFAGSGTTGVACKRLGRRFLGWEKDPKYHAAAVRRIAAARQQYELLRRPPKPKQGKLLP